MSDWNGFGGIDLTEVEADKDRTTLRPGSYICKIIEAEVVDTRDRKGKGLKVQFADVDGGGKVGDFINLQNRNEEAQRIGLQKLKALLIAAKHPNPDRPRDVGSLKGLTVGVRVEQGEDWVDNNGQTKPGGGKVRRSGAYFDPSQSNERIGPNPSAMTPFTAPRAGGNGGRPLNNDRFNDEIPF